MKLRLVTTARTSSFKHEAGASGLGWLRGMFNEYATYMTELVAQRTNVNGSILKEDDGFSALLKSEWNKSHMFMSIDDASEVLEGYVNENY